MLSPRGQNFGLGLGFKTLASASPLASTILASAWPRSTTEEPAAKKKRTSPFADYRTSHNAAGKQTDDKRQTS